MDPARLQVLNGLVHPAVFRLEEQMLRNFEQSDPRGIAVIEAAILIEAGRRKMFDRLIVTTCNLETQIARGIARDKLTREEVMARLERQMPQDEKLRYADYVIDTDGFKSATAEQVERVYEELKGLAAS
jgi:dephospho-CoA kinase